MVSIDVDELKRTAPQDRIVKIQALRRVVDDSVKLAEKKASDARQILDELEEATTKELGIITRVTATLTSQVVEPKKERTLEQITATLPETLKNVQQFAERDAYSRIASIRNKVAAGQELQPAEMRTVEYYGALVDKFTNVATYVSDPKTKEILTRTEKAIEQIESYKTRTMKDETEQKQKRSEF